MRSLTMAAFVALLAAGTTLGQTSLTYELLLGGDNALTTYKTDPVWVPYSGGNAADGQTIDRLGGTANVINWAAKVLTSGPTVGAANLVYDLELHEGATVGTLAAVSASAGAGCGAEGYCSTIQDGTMNGRGETDDEKKAAFAVAIEANLDGVFGRLFDAVADGGANLDYYTFPSADGFPVGSTAAAGTLVGQGAGYSSFTIPNDAGGFLSGGNLGGIGCAAGSCTGTGAQFVESGNVVLFEGQINTAGLADGTYTLRLVAKATGNNVLKDFDPLFPAGAPVDSFADGVGSIADLSGGVGAFGAGEGGDTITFSLIGGGSTAVNLTSAVSRKVHGAAGTFDVNILAANAVEPRTGGATKVVLGFDGAITLACGDIALVSGSCANMTDLGGGTSWSFDITGSTQNACQKVTITNAGLTGSPAVLEVDNHRGDVNGSAQVDVVDLSAVKGALFAPVTGGNFKLDVDASGQIDVVDLSTVKGNLFALLVACP